MSHLESLYLLIQLLRNHVTSKQAAVTKINNAKIHKLFAVSLRSEC